MSYIPDCRSKYEKDCEIHSLFPPKEPIDDNQINPYWYGLLNSPDKDFVCGYDWCTRNAVCNLFDNLDVYIEELEDIGIDVDEIDMNIVNGAYGAENENINFNSELTDQRDCLYYDDYDKEELENMTISTKRMLAIKTILLDYIEKERDMLVTSMIDDMSEEEHEKAMEQAKE